MKNKKKAFARRFNVSDWMLLCNSGEFEMAFSEGDFARCEVLAYQILDPCVIR